MRSHAILMREYGLPSVLTYAERDLPALGPEEVRIRTIAAAVNHTDLEVRAGNWRIQKPEPFPYVPGVEVVGEIEDIGADVHEVQRGDRVITVMQGLGGVRALRHGSYAEHVTVPALVVARLPAGVDPIQMAAIGLVGVTAYEALRRIGALSKKRIVVTGAAGGIGSAATAIAHAQGAFVTGVIIHPEQADYVRSLGADEVIVFNRHEISAALGAERVHGVLDAVAGDLFAPCVAALVPGGTLSLVGAVGGSHVGFDVFELTRRVMLTGYSSEMLNGGDLRAAIGRLAGWLSDGSIKPPSHRSLPLSHAAEAHALLEQGRVAGRLLLVPEE